MNKELLVQLIIDGFRRIITHYGLWFAEVEHQVGLDNCLEIEKVAGDNSFNIQLQRLAKTFGFEMENGVPKFLLDKSEDELKNILEKVAVNWLANDGVWFQAVEKKFGMNDAKRCNDSCWTRFSPYEAFRIKEILCLPEQAGIEGLKKALEYRMYSFINKQSIEVVDENRIIFKMNDCRVQSARKRKGLEDYPCKSAGLVEYAYFSRMFDSRIKTKCIACPPDSHPEEYYCAWEFYIEQG